MKYIIDKVFTEGFGILAGVIFLIWGIGYIALEESQRGEREQVRIIKLVTQGTPLPEARCAIKGC